jgi:DinB family protein
MPLSADVLDRLQTMPRLLRDAVDQISPQDYSKPAANGDFSFLEQACHLRDLEREGYLIRIQKMLREENPLLADFDGAKVAAERNYRAQDLLTAVRDFEQSRFKALDILRGLSDDQLARRGQFGEMRAITLRDLVDMMLEHDAGHRREIQGLLEEIQSRPQVQP